MHVVIWNKRVNLGCNGNQINMLP